MAGESRSRFIEHRGARIYLIDCEGLDARALVQLMPAVARDVRGQPPGSVRTLMWVKGLQFDASLKEDLKRLSDGNKPFVKASAIAGLSGVQFVFYRMMMLLVRRQFRLFETLDEAKDYLASVA